MEKYSYSILSLVFAGFIALVYSRVVLTKYKQAIEKPFKLLCILTFIFCIIDSIWGIFMQSPYELTDKAQQTWYVFLVIFTYTWHICICFSAFVWTEYIHAFLHTNRKRNKLFLTIRLIFLLSQILLLATNNVHHLLFSFVDMKYEIEYYRFILFIIVTIFFTVSFLYTLVEYFKEIRNKQYRRQCLAASMFSFVPILATALQLIPGSTLIPLFSAAFAMSVVLLYIFNLNDIKEKSLFEQYDSGARMQQESIEMVQSLSTDYSSIFYVDLKTSMMTIYRLSNESKKIFGNLLYKQVNFSEFLLTFLEKEVQNSDKEELIKLADPNYLRSIIKPDEAFTYTYRCGTEDDFEYYQTKVIQAKNDDTDTIIVGITNVDKQIRQEMIYQQELQKARDAAESASKAKTSFLFNMSHDIRTPMNAIMGFTDMAIKNINTQEKVQNCLTKVKDSSEHLLSLINDVLDMSRIESGKFDAAYSQADINYIVEATTSMLNVNAKIKNQTLVYNLNIKHPFVLIDEMHTQRVLINIVGNSIKYTPNGGHISIDVIESASEKDGFATYTFICKDDGIGMDAEYVKTIFEPFSRDFNNQTKHIQGTGLGMAITKNIVDKLGGTISVESEKGKGTTISISFELEIAEKVSKQIQTELDPTSINLGGKKILLVDDNELNREIACAILEDEGLLVEQADDGAIAVDKVKSHEPDYYDAVLMDVQMPIMDGYAATKAIRTMEGEKYKDLVIIAMTANAFDEDKKIALENGMNAHLVKPIDVNKLKETLLEFIK